MDLNNMKAIRAIDKDNMRDLLISFPNQCEEALSIGRGISIKSSHKRRYSNIVFTGLGGSAIGADIIKGYLDKEISIPIFVNRDYAIPRFVDKNSLVFAVSYSGNTEETLSAYAEVKKAGSKVVVITSGGKLKAKALKNKDVVITVPSGYPPRAALGYSFIPGLMALGKLGIIRNKAAEIKKAIKFMRRMKPDAEAKEIAKKVHDKFPAIYSADKHMYCIATRWRGQFAENSKTLSSSHVFPEMNHNEIVGWVYPKTLLRSSFIAVILKDDGDHDRVKKRMRITTSILKKANFKVVEVKSKGKTLLERMLSLIYIGDFASFYLALLNREDPTPVDRITYLKKELVK